MTRLHLIAGRNARWETPVELILPHLPEPHRSDILARHAACRLLKTTAFVWWQGQRMFAELEFEGPEHHGLRGALDLWTIEERT